MGLEIIHIKNYKCIRDYKINLKQMNLLLGENGSGKTNILSAIDYFYGNMISQKISYDVFDENNPLNDQLEITLVYDLKKLLIRSRKNRKEGKIKYEKYYRAMERMADKGKVSLSLTQIKGGKITWNRSIEERKLLYHMYPLYKLDAREINLVDWEELWEDIGDLIKPDSKASEETQSEIMKVLNSDDGIWDKRLEMLGNIFDRLEIRPVKFSVKDFSANISKIYYEGKDFSYIGHRLDNFSNGTNSFNYISLMLHVLSAMGRSKMKEPILLMDEPEISLHFLMIDELSDEIFSCVNDITILAATHSPRFVKNVLVKENYNCTLYQVYKRNNYSQLCLLNMFSDDEKREKVFLTEHHVNAFFAKMIILVEGETELELLQNPYLRILFPILKQTEIIKGMSDKVIYRIVDTTTRHYNVPMIALVDMDKILQWDFEKKCMIWKTDYHFISEREKFYYGDRRNKTEFMRKRIQSMCNKCKFTYWLPFYACDDNNYIQLIQVIKEYHNIYNIFPLRTTIEGALINENNLSEILLYLSHIGKKKSIETGFQKLFFYIDKINFIRLLFHGKSDLLLNTKGVLNLNTKIYPVLKNTLESNSIRKTDWVSEWIKFYFCIITQIPYEKMTESKFATWCAVGDNKKNLEERFSRDFSELTDFIKIVTHTYNNGI